MEQEIKVKTLASERELSGREQAAAKWRSCPIPNNELLANAGLFLKRQELTKHLFFADLYENHILPVHGVMMEFGVRWGQNLVTLNNLRGLLEPFNHNRKLIGFDTFEGFPVLSEKDGQHDIIAAGSLAVSRGYENYLQELLDFHQGECPLHHIQKNFLRKGNAIVELEKYLNEHPETIIAFAWFDMTLYEPTMRCLELIRPYLTRGAVIGFDELNDREFPGETIAVREALGTANVRIQRSRFSGAQSFVIFEG
ncbi:MAG: crotonobetainyl-CoA--carnitine CoA-transferase [Flavobacteriales bacterium]